MEYYLAKSGEKVGPMTQFKLVEMLRDGEVSADTKAWHQGMEGWLPISEVPSLKSAISALENETEGGEPPPIPDAPTQRTVKIAEEVRPLTRFFARHFDYALVFVAVLVFSDIEAPETTPDMTISDMMAQSWEMANSEEHQQLARMLLFSFPLWHIVEGIMISLFGTTPGKALFGIHVLKPSGKRLSIPEGIYRSFLVYILGVGLFFVPLNLITMAYSFVRLMVRGICPWDQMLSLRVNHPPLSFGRILLAILAFITLMMLQNLNFS